MPPPHFCLKRIKVAKLDLVTKSPIFQIEKKKMSNKGPSQPYL